MDRSIQKNGLINLLVLALAGGIALALARHTQSQAGTVGAILLGLGTLVAAVSWFQMRLAERESLEKLEFDELARSRGSATLFAGKDEGTFPARQSRLQFEKFFVPGFTVLLLLLEAAAAWWMWQFLSKSALLPLQKTLVGMAAFALVFLGLFILGKYAAGLSRAEENRMLRPGAGWLLLGAYLCLLITAGIALEELGLKRVDFYLARGFTVLLAVLAVETLLSLLLEIYRPRVKGQAARPVYESRLVGLLAHPEGLFTTAAHTLDYQFGFKVSETWAYQVFVEKLPGFVLVVAAVGVLSSSFVFLDPGEEALLERMGRPVNGGKFFGPGAHVKLPWPVDKVYRIKTGEVRSFNVGFTIDTNFAAQKTVLWTMPHYKEELPFLVASRDQQSAGISDQSPSQAVPVSLLDAGIPVQFRITNVVAWAYGYADAQPQLEQLATREVVRYFASADLLDIMSEGRERAAADLKHEIQKRAEELKLGVQILFVGLQDIHPPTSVAESFQAVNGAAQEVEAKVYKAEGEAAKTTLLAQANALERERAAEGDALSRTSGATAQGARFAHQAAAYEAAPDYYANRLYLQTFAQASTATRKYIVASTNSHQVFQINLEDKIRPDLMDINLTPETP